MKEGSRATLLLILLLTGIFFPALWGNKTLLMSAWDVPSVMPGGAYQPGSLPPVRINRSPDSGAAGWQAEPWYGIISNQYWTEHRLPLWNPYSAYGTPFAAAMQPQPFYPLTALLSLYPTAWTYNFYVVARLLVAGLLTFFFARLFLGFLPAVFSAITFMLTGYLILFLSMPHLSVEVLLPALFLSLELLLRRNSWGAVIGVAGVILLSIVGGMPESLFLAVSFGCLYFLFRFLTISAFRELPLERLGKFVAAVALGFALGGFLLLPFLEFMRVSHNLHQPSNLSGGSPGLLSYADLRPTVTYFLPMLFGPVGSDPKSSFFAFVGYWGVLPSIFAMAALFCSLFPKRTNLPKPLIQLTVFFAGALGLMLLKKLGSPLINWIGLLPLSEQVIYPKYQEPLMGFCVAMLSGIGFSQVGLIKRTYFLVAALVVLGVVLGLVSWNLPRLLAPREFKGITYLALLGGVFVVLAAVWLLAFAREHSAPAWLRWGFLGLLAAELSGNFILPSYYVFNSLPSVKVTPYAGAPYLDFLRSHNSDHSRVFARESVLYPNWSGAFAITDVRALDAMYYRRYIDFIRSFLLKLGDEKRGGGDLADRFTGGDFAQPGSANAYNFETELEKRFLALSSIKYLIGTSEYGSSTVVDDIAAQHQAENLPLFGISPFQLNGRTWRALFQHPPSKRVAFKTVIDRERPVLEGIAAIKSEAYPHTDGVEFQLELDIGNKIETLFSTFLNPRDVETDRHGRRFRVDMSRYAGLDVTLLFSTDPGPMRNAQWDWAGWVNLRFLPVDATKAPEPFKKIYDEEVYVYEVPHVLPRASLFHAAEIVPEADVLQRLKDTNLDPDKTVILSRETLSAEDLAAVASVAGSQNDEKAQISRYESQRVEIAAETHSPALLMLNDANYPGWRAYVNGMRVPIFHADYLFRAVIVPAGKSTVQFVYEPTSFRVGSLVSLLALGIMVVLMFRPALAVAEKVQAL